jgi:hypothetical protein
VKKLLTKFGWKLLIRLSLDRVFVRRTQGCIDSLVDTSHRHLQHWELNVVVNYVFQSIDGENCKEKIVILLGVYFIGL